MRQCGRGGRSSSYQSIYSQASATWILDLGSRMDVFNATDSVMAVPDDGTTVGTLYSW